MSKFNSVEEAKKFLSDIENNLIEILVKQANTNIEYVTNQLGGNKNE